MIGATRFGSTSLNMIRMLPAPSEREASMNSFSLIESVFPRTMRAMYGQPKSAMTKITSAEPGLHEAAQAAFGAVTPHAATMPIANSRIGIERMTSIDPRDPGVELAAEEAGEHAEDRPDEDGDARGDERDEQRRPRAVDRAHEDVATGLVGAEDEVLVRPVRQPERVGHLALVEVVRAVADEPSR